MDITTEQRAALDRVLEAWAEGIRAHEPQRVAAGFTEDAIFQGFDAGHTVGRAGVSAYYDKQPIGLTADYRVVETRALSPDLILAYLDVDFTLPDGTVIPVHLTLIAARVDDAWLIRHYHVSKIGG